MREVFVKGHVPNKNPLLVSSNSSPAVLQPLLKKKTKTGKNNREFSVAFLVLLLMILYVLGTFLYFI
jgi:hypothetical protein